MSQERNKYIRENPVSSGRLETGQEYWVVSGPTFVGGLNGYVLFPQRPVRELGYGGILNYVPVHGGITYAEKEGRGMVYGFDTAHAHSESVTRHDPEWVRGQCQIMASGIMQAAKVEARYLRCISQQGKAKLAQTVLDINPDEEANFGTMINILSGKL